MKTFDSIQFRIKSIHNRLHISQRGQKKKRDGIKVG